MSEIKITLTSAGEREEAPILAGILRRMAAAALLMPGEGDFASLCEDIAAELEGVAGGGRADPAAPDATGHEGGAE